MNLLCPSCQSKRDAETRVLLDAFLAKMVVRVLFERLLG